MDKEFKEILGAQLVSTTGGVIAGLLLAVFINKLELIPVMFMLLPGFFEMKGSIGGSLTARLGSALHKGTLKPSGYSSKLLSEGVASFLLLLAASSVLGVIAFALGGLTLGIYNPRVILIPILAVMILSAFEIIMFIYASLWLYRHGHDPNNIMGPYVTTLGDITSVISLVAASLIVL